MISLKINNLPVKFETTLFPDGTSQVWKLDRLPQPEDTAEILWMFQSEAEVFRVIQLASLLSEYNVEDIVLNVPFLPYGRQDKEYGNDSCFALETLRYTLLHAGISTIKTYDAHSSASGAVSTPPTAFHQAVFNHDVICFPDAGALERYRGSFPNVSNFLFCEKVRNQATGEITGLELYGKTVLPMSSILIMDDICDGGMTFIKVAELLKREVLPLHIDLAVSHGIFSKGKQVLHDAGIRNIFTTNSLFGNPDGYKVC